MEVTRLRELINKVRHGRATPLEQKELEEFCVWARTDDELFNSLSEEDKEAIRVSIYRRVTSKIGFDERRRFLLPSIIRIAASLSALAIVAFAFYWFNTDSGNYVTIASSYGEHKQIILPDSSIVIMNGNSSVRYSDSWDSNRDREVWLSGEAFFDVRHTRTDTRFTVHTEEDLKVTVLGTRFNVKVRRGKAQVMLEEGRVRVTSEQGSHKTFNLDPGELATFYEGILTKELADPLWYASWKDNTLYFHETPLSEVGEMLEDTYGYQVSFVDASLEGRKLSGRIQSQNLYDVLTAIAEALDVDIKTGEKRIEIGAR